MIFMSHQNMVSSCFVTLLTNQSKVFEAPHRIPRSLPLCTLSSRSLPLCTLSSRSLPWHPTTTTTRRAHRSQHPYRQIHMTQAEQADNPTWPIPETPTPLTPITFREHTVYIKRDDQLNFAGLSGSKLRKFHSLFTDENLHQSDCVVSYGGGQSNAMLALARLCQFRCKPFVYITRPLPNHLATTNGNFHDALTAGMFHLPLDNQSFQQFFTDMPPQSLHTRVKHLLKENSFPFPTARSFFIPQGGAWHGAETGVARLADELREQIAGMQAEGMLGNKLPILFLPCGTGTTAFYLQRHLENMAKVIAVPVSGSERYLVKQMRWLEACHNEHGGETHASIFPGVLRPRLRASFADIRPEKLLIWQELRRATLETFDFDLIYAPKAWEEVFYAVEEGRIAQNGESLLYYHTGGVEGNVSMLDRFNRHGLIPT